MSTWTSRRAAIAFLAGLLGSGCTMTAPSAGGADTPPAITRARLGPGGLEIAAPRGYCFDTASMTEKRDFVLLARCDTLGRPGAFQRYPLAVVSIAVAPLPEDIPPPTAAALAAAAAPAEVTANRDEDGLALIRLGSGAPVLGGGAAQRWRAAFSAQGQIVALGLYAPDGSGVDGNRGAGLLRELVRRSRAPATAEQHAPSQNALGGMFDGLFR